MSPDLNSLPLSTEEARGASPSGPPGENVQQESSPPHARPSSSDSPTTPEAPPARRSPRPRSAMRLDIHDSTLPLGVGGQEGRRHSPNLYRASSARREGLTGGGLSSPRSPISGPTTQGDPHHQRAPSIGELHQELEQEQEAQVNRLLQMIRRQQAQLDQLQSQSTTTTEVGESGTSTSNALTDEPGSVAVAAPATRQLSTGLHGASHTSSPHSMRSRSRRSSQASPLHANPPLDAAAGAGSSRDEAAFYATENQSLQRENQILRVRIRELERRVRDMETRERGVEHKNDESTAVPSAM